MKTTLRLLAFLCVLQAALCSAQQSVTGLVLINADTDLDIGPLTEGMVINMALTGTSLNVRADTSPAVVGSVRFALDGNANFRTETAAPYALGGDVPTGNYTPWTPALGAHTVKATPYTAAAAGGTAGTALTVNFSVINQPPATAPTANSGGDKTVILPASSATLTGSGTDPDGTIASYAWTQVSGPSTAVLSGAATPVLTVSTLIQGTYVFRLTVTDNSSLTGTADASVFVVPAGTGSAVISGELKKWHKVTLSFTGPQSSEAATPNPFTDYRLSVTFSHAGSGKSYAVPGYFAADGNAANSSATAGNVWRVHFAPDATGPWTWTASFRSGAQVAISDSTAAGVSGGFMDATTGTFTIVPTDKTGRDNRAKGRLEYVGKHHLRFAETGEFFLKAGTDAPENLLAYADIDGDFKTDGHKDNLIKTWTAHIADWQPGDPVWQNTKGKGLIGAINYLASEGLNAFSFLTMNIDGDDQNVYPYTVYGERLRMDVSRLDQWEIIFAQGTKLGMYLHFKTQETENEMLLDNGDTGPQRKLYYRELIARFGHHLAMNWNLGEENGALGTVNQNTAQRQAMAQYFYDHDPYHHPIVIHNGKLPTDLLGNLSRLTGYSMQTNLADFTDVFSNTKSWVDQSAAAGVPWVVACDEPGDASHALRPDNDAGNSHIDGRKHALWGQVMAGGAGSEFYFGYSHAHSDLSCEDFRSRDLWWDFCRYELEFFKSQSIPFQEMSNRNPLVSGNGNNTNRCLAKTGEVYLVQLPAGGTATLNLAGVTGTFTVRWFNPRTGGSLITGAVSSVTGGGVVSLGAPPATTTEDWIVLVRSGSGTAVNTPPVCNAGPDISAVLTAATVEVTLNGSVTDDGLPAGSALTRSWTQVSGPASVVFSNAAAAVTTVTFPSAGVWVLRLSASDSALSASDDVQITVTLPVGGNRPPVFPGYTFRARVNAPRQVLLTTVLSTATDPDGDPVTAAPGNLSTTAGGSVTISADRLTYRAPIDHTGADSFTLPVSDGRGGSATGTVQVEVVADDTFSTQLPALTPQAGGTWSVHYLGLPGLPYLLERSTTLNAWTPIGESTASPAGEIDILDPAPPADHAFYRITAPSAE